MTKKQYNLNMSESHGQAKQVPQYIAALSVCLGSVAAGTVLGWTANIDSKLRSGNLNDVVIESDSDMGWISSLTTLGAMCMCFPIGYLCEVLGRKLTMLLTIVPFTVGWLLIIFADGLAMIFVGRFLIGMAGGAFCVAAPLYTSEIAQKEIRGALGSYFQLLLTVGILIAYILGKFMEPQGLSIVCAVIPFVFGVVFFLQPETPFYLIKKGRDADALNSLKRLRGANYNCQAEMDEIKQQLDNDAKNKVSFVDALQTVAAKKAVFICFGLMLFQQFSGINAVIFYTSNIFESAGSTIEVTDATIYVGVTQVVATFISSLIVDKFGRKILLIASGFFMMLSAVLLGIFFTIKEEKLIDDISTLGWLPIVSMMLFIGMFSMGYGPIPWMASAEIFPPGIKATASSAAATFNWLLAFIVTKVYPELDNTIHGNTFYIFGGISLIGVFFVYFIVPETKGKSTLEVQAMLEGNSSAPRHSNGGISNPSYSK